MQTKIVIVGATSSIATHCARIWVATEQAAEFVLLGRDAARLERVASDLRVRNALARVTIKLADFLNPAAIQFTVNEIESEGKIDIALIAHGSLGDQEKSQNDLAFNYTELHINAVSPVLYAEAFAQQMAKTGKGTVVVIGSVAGDRGRQSNYVYGAAKGLVSRYVQGLQHRFAGTSVKVILIKPGPTDTPMTVHLKDQGMRLASVEEVAKGIVSAVNAGKLVAYVPGKWALIMMIIRHLPNFIFNKLRI
jgi:short-subunit dehydrogenase